MASIVAGTLCSSYIFTPISMPLLIFFLATFSSTWMEGAGFCVLLAAGHKKLGKMKSREAVGNH